MVVRRHRSAPGTPHRVLTGGRWRFASVLVTLFVGVTSWGVLLCTRAHALVFPLVITILAVAIAAIALRVRETIDDRERK